MKQFILFLAFSFFFLSVHSQENTSNEKKSSTDIKYKSHNYRWGRLLVDTQEGYELEIFPITNEIVRVSLRKDTSLSDVNSVVKVESDGVQMDVKEEKDALHITSGFLTLVIQKKSLQISYYYKGEFLTEHNCFESLPTAIDFTLKKGELFYGLGSQMKSNSLNGSSYHFENSVKSNNSIPLLISTQKYLLFFDNLMVQSVDIDKNASKELNWKIGSENFSFYLMGGKNYRSLLKSYFQLVGRQGIPPRYLIGAVNSSELEDNQFVWDRIMAKVWNRDTLIKRKVDTTNIYLKYKILNKEYEKEYSKKRIYHLEDNFFVGATAYSVCPRLEKKNTSWNTLKFIVPQMLHASVSGFPYAHFRIDGNTEEELSIAILQIAAFSPLLIYEAKDFEFYSEKSKSIIKQILEEREKLKPYFYTLAWQQATLGDLLVKPSFFNYPEEIDKLKFGTSFLAGNNLLIYPVLKKNISTKNLYLPKGRWYSYHSYQAYDGGQMIKVNIQQGEMPVFVKGGTFLPRVSISKPYKLDSLWLTYYPAAKEGTYNSRIYEDDGKSPKAWKYRKSEIMNFQATEEKSLLSLTFRKQFFEYKGRIKKRQMVVNILRNGKKIRKVFLRGEKLKMKEVGSEGDYYSVNEEFITIYFDWEDQDVVVEVKY